jgi:hypothetical protein
MTKRTITRRPLLNRAFNPDALAKVTGHARAGTVRITDKTVFDHPMRTASIHVTGDMMTHAAAAGASSGGPFITEQSEPGGNAAIDIAKVHQPPSGIGVGGGSHKTPSKG